MSTQLLKKIDHVYRQTSRLTCKTVEQCIADFANELKTISQHFDIDDVEALFLLSIIINNTEYKNCQLEDIADKMEFSRFEALANIHVLYSLQGKGLIEINEPEEILQENRRFSGRSKYPIEIMNKSFVISKMVENSILEQSKNV